MFNLVDIEAPVRAGGRRPPAPGNRLVSTGAGAVLATFNSELEDNEPHVDLEYWSAAPPAPEGAWEAWESHAREGLAVDGGLLTLASGISGDGASHRLALPPGNYHLDAWCRGRTEARAAELDAVDAGTLPYGVERWLVRLWPATRPW